MTDTASATPTTGNPSIATPEADASGAKRSYKRIPKSLSELERDISHYPPEILKEATWLLGFWIEHCERHIPKLRGICAKLKHEKSDSYFHNILNGYMFNGGTSDWQPGRSAWSDFIALVSSLRRYGAETNYTGKQPFVETPTYRCIDDFITSKRATNAVCKIGGITGPTGAQKSQCYKHYRAQHPHGTVIHVEAPANGRLTALQAKIARAYNVEQAHIERRREGVVRDNVNASRTIIIDNAQVLYLVGKGADQPAFNWIRELQDDTGCTIILSFTTDFVDVLTAGAARGYFEQFIGRMGGVDALLKLPEYADEADLRCIAHSFKLEPGKGAMEWLTTWSRRVGRIRIVFEKLQKAAEFAELDKHPRITLADMNEADQFRPTAIGTFDLGAKEGV